MAWRKAQRRQRDDTAWLKAPAPGGMVMATLGHGGAIDDGGPSVERQRLGMEQSPGLETATGGGAARSSPTKVNLTGTGALDWGAALERRWQGTSSEMLGRGRRRERA
jgi:hypothetical protein